MNAPSAKPRRRARTARVLRTEHVSPQMIRVIFGGDDLDGLPVGEFTDHYVKLQFPPTGAPYQAPFDTEQIRAEHGSEWWPVVRTYTVRRWDAERGELSIDFVVHGSEGVAGPWAAHARAGDVLQLMGPGGAFAPDPEADWHLLAGDESALPAIAAALDRVPADKPTQVFLEVQNVSAHQVLPTGPNIHITWVHREGDHDAGLLCDAVRAGDWLPGRLCAFVHGEAASVRQLRRLLRVERAVSADQLSVSGYWRRGRTEEGWRDDKAEWKRQVELDEAQGAAMPRGQRV